MPVPAVSLISSIKHSLSYKEFGPLGCCFSHTVSKRYQPPCHNITCICHNFSISDRPWQYCGILLEN